MNGDSTTAEMSPGILSKEQVQCLFETGKITCIQYGPPDVDGSAFDLRLGTTAWKLTEGQRPATRELARIKGRSLRIAPESDEDGEYLLFEKQQIYLVELDYHLNLPSNINGRATGKSSTGRLDVITRLLTENSSEYDVVEEGYSGSLHLLIIPQSFSIKVRPSESLNQLRLFSGPPYASVITQPLIHHFGTPFWYVPHPSRVNDYEDWDTIANRYGKSSTADPTLFDLTVDLADPRFQYIYKAIPEVTETIDLRKGNGSHEPTHYFEKVEIESDGAAQSVLLERGSFYIMKSRERLYIPPDVAVEVIAISERIGISVSTMLALHTLDLDGMSTSRSAARH